MYYILVFDLSYQDSTSSKKEITAGEKSDLIYFIFPGIC
jgi:hypothetical protein